MTGQTAVAGTLNGDSITGSCDSSRRSRCAGSASGGNRTRLTFMRLMLVKQSAGSFFVGLRWLFGGGNGSSGRRGPVSVGHCGA